jgi:uncharacterized protein YehS (DUF1456 family)
MSPILTDQIQADQFDQALFATIQLSKLDDGKLVAKLVADFEKPILQNKLTNENMMKLLKACSRVGDKKHLHKIAKILTHKTKIDSLSCGELQYLIHLLAQCEFNPKFEEVLLQDIVDSLYATLDRRQQLYNKERDEKLASQTETASTGDEVSKSDNSLKDSSKPTRDNFTLKQLSSIIVSLASIIERLNSKYDHRIPSIKSESLSEALNGLIQHNAGKLNTNNLISVRALSNKSLVVGSALFTPETRSMLDQQFSA